MSNATQANAVLELQNYYAGGWVGSSKSEYSDVINPATSEKLARVPVAPKKMLTRSFALPRPHIPHGAERRPKTAFSIFSSSSKFSRTTSMTSREFARRKMERRSVNLAPNCVAQSKTSKWPAAFRL